MFWFLRQVRENLSITVNSYQFGGYFTYFRVNIQDVLQVFKGCGIGKMEDNLTSADPLSYTTNGSRGDLVNWV